MSPVYSQPLRSARLVSSSWFQYPWNSCGPKTTSSPAAPIGSTRSCRTSSTILTWVFGSGRPMVPGRELAFSGLARVTGEDSVMP